MILILIAATSCCLLTTISPVGGQNGTPLQAEPRAGPNENPNVNNNGNLRPVIDQLVNLFNSYTASQQQQQQQQQQAALQQQQAVLQQRRQSLPVPLVPQRNPQLATGGSMGGLAGPGAGSGRPRPGPGPSYLGAGQLSLPQQIQPASSSPSTPYLTLNRLASYAGSGQQMGAPAGGHSYSQPTGFAGSLGGPRANYPGANGQQPIAARPLAPSIPLQRPAPAASPPRPLVGFAPSGPPPGARQEETRPPVASQDAPEQQPGGPSSSAPPTQTTLPATTIATSRVTTQSGQSSGAPGRGQETPTSTDSTEEAPVKASAATTTPATAPTGSGAGNGGGKPTTASSAFWSPLGAGGRGAPQAPAVPLAPSPDIVTVPPSYNPDSPNASQPQSYDISVSAQMGGPVPARGPEVAPDEQTAGSAPVPASSVVPTAVTTIFWSPPPATIVATGSPPTPPLAPSRVTERPVQTETVTLPTTPLTPAVSPGPKEEEEPPASTGTSPTSLSSYGSSTASPASPSPNSSPNPNPNPSPTVESGVVYGKTAAGRDSQPAPPAPSAPPTPAPVPSDASSGRPFVQVAPMDAQVRPIAAGSGRPPPASPPISAAGAAGAAAPRPQQRSPIDGPSFSIQVAGSGNQTMPTGDIHDYLGGGARLPEFNAEPTISSQGGPEPTRPSEAREPSSPAPPPSSGASAAASPAPAAPPTHRVRRPTFKPKPAIPPIRIDSCIVGDDSSCDQSHNERCVTEYGISSCHCKPGFARLSQLRGFCSPISLVQLTLKIDKLSDDRRLAFNATLENPNSEEYQYLEFEVLQTMAGIFQQSSIAGQFVGARVNKFFERKGKVHANMSVNLEVSNVTRNEQRVQQLVTQELTRTLQAVGQTGSGASPARKVQVGDSTVVLDLSAPKEVFSKLQDVNECASKELNDCSKFATCSNEFGSFQCHCLPGYEDKHLAATTSGAAPSSAQQETSGSGAAAIERSKMGRVCVGCSPGYCSNRGECSIVDGQKQCKCRANFLGSRCDIDSEVLAVAIGGSLVGLIILIVTFWCLFVFNKRWRREQQKMDAISATSGLTYNYVSSASNSLMSPANGLHVQRAGGHISRLTTGNQRRGTGYAPSDQQAIIGSSLSGSSASSQQFGVGLGHAYLGAAGQYDEAAGLLIGPTSSGSSADSSPSSATDAHLAAAAAAHFASHNHLPGAYTLSGHHHHHHAQQSHLLHNGHAHHHNHKQAGGSRLEHMAQFHPAADYRSLKQPHQVYDARWPSAADSKLMGYYLSPDMLMTGQSHHHHQQQQQQQQLYASPQRELCVDTSAATAAHQMLASMAANNHTIKSNRKQQGRVGQTVRSRSTAHRNGALMYHSSEYER